MVREAHHVKSLFNTGVMLYLTGIAVLVLLGLISGTAGESLVGAGRGEPAV
ncbi:inner membrane protein [Klebsiella pneumoniae]|uniref:Inner membrane protein n=1 Tax=Klebsiella pneumoniae TaxID=573 RepID=A0A4P0YB24_KLEPN|nr:inner membrane protein [Klebsiella pneumoniae]